MQLLTMMMLLIIILMANLFSNSIGNNTFSTAAVKCIRLLYIEASGFALVNEASTKCCIQA